MSSSRAGYGNTASWRTGDALVRRGLATVAAQPEADTWRLGRGEPPTTRWNVYGRPLGTPPRFIIDRAKMARDAAGQARRKERKETT